MKRLIFIYLAVIASAFGVPSLTQQIATKQQAYLSFSQGDTTTALGYLNSLIDTDPSASPVELQLASYIYEQSLWLKNNHLSSKSHDLAKLALAQFPSTLPSAWSDGSKINAFLLQGQILESPLSDLVSAKQKYQQVVAIAPAHKQANAALKRLNSVEDKSAGNNLLQSQPSSG